MPHLCDKMRRLTTKDLGKRKKVDDGPTPDFYALSRENPLPESTPVPTTTLTPPAIAAAVRPTSDGMSNPDVELALLERRRADIFNRMNLLAGSNGMRPDVFGSSQEGLPMNNNSLVAAAALSLGNNGRPNGLTPASLHQQSFLGGVSNVGQIFDSNSALQRQLLEARLANSDMAAILGFNGGAGGGNMGNMQNFNGFLR